MVFLVDTHFLMLWHMLNKYYSSWSWAFKAFEGISDSAKPYFDSENLFGRTATVQLKRMVKEIRSWLIMDLLPGIRFEIKEFASWATFLSTLAYIIDTDDVTLRDPMEDLDWMS